MKFSIQKITHGWVLAGLMLFLGTASYAQERLASISGTVMDPAEAPLPGVTIKVKNAENGSVTDLNGSFNIKAGLQDILIFSFVGFETKEVPINGRTLLKIVLDENLTQLDEIAGKNGHN